MELWNYGENYRTILQTMDLQTIQYGKFMVLYRRPWNYIKYCGTIEKPNTTVSYN